MKKEFTIDDLKTGMLIMDDAGHYGIVLKDGTYNGNGRIVSLPNAKNETYFPIYGSETFKDPYIKEVWSINYSNKSALSLSTNDRTLLWEREEHPKIVINGHDVEFTDDGIKVGCQSISKDTIEEIYNHLKGI